MCVLSCISKTQGSNFSVSFQAKKFVRTEPLGVACPYRAQLWADICCYHAKVPHSGSFYVNTAGLVLVFAHTEYFAQTARTLCNAYTFYSVTQD